MSANQMSQGRTLETRIHEAFRLHVETDNGLIAGSTRLLPRVVHAVADWLKEKEDIYRDSNHIEAAEALRDLHLSLIGEGEPKPGVWLFQHSGMHNPAEVPGRWMTEAEARRALLRFFHRPERPEDLDTLLGGTYQFWRKGEHRP